MSDTPVLPATERAPAAPASPAELFRGFTRLAMQGVGGGLAVAQRGVSVPEVTVPPC